MVSGTELGAQFLGSLDGLLDGAVAFVVGQGAVFGAEDEVEGNALLALADLLTCIDVEELDALEDLAGRSLDGLFKDQDRGDLVDDEG